VYPSPTPFTKPITVEPPIRPSKLAASRRQVTASPFDDAGLALAIDDRDPKFPTVSHFPLHFGCLAAEITASNGPVAAALAAQCGLRLRLGAVVLGPRRMREAGEGTPAPPATMAATGSGDGYQIAGVCFASFTPEEVRRLSVQRIGNPVAFDNLNNPTEGGLYDPSLGPLENTTVCRTCSLLGTHCPGHTGHIELPLPVYNPIFFTPMFNLLRGTCLYCHRMRQSRAKVHQLVAQLRLLDFGLLVAAKAMEEIFDESAAAEESAAGGDGDGTGDSGGGFWQRRITQAYEDALREAGLDPATATPNLRTRIINVQSYRRELVQAFLAASIAQRTCLACGGIARRLTHETHVKVFAHALKRRDQEKMERKHLEMKGGKTVAAVTGPASDDGLGESMDEGESSGSSEDEGESSSSSEDAEGGGDEGKGKSNGKGIANGKGKAQDKGTGKAQDKGNSRGKLAAVELQSSLDAAPSRGKMYVTPILARGHLDGLWAMEDELMPLLFTSLLVAGASAGLKRCSS